METTDRKGSVKDDLGSPNARIDTSFENFEVEDRQKQRLVTIESDGMVDRRHSGSYFILLTFLAIFVNYDSGGIPALLTTIQSVFALNHTEEGLLGGLPYLGLVVMSLVSGRLLSSERIKKKWLLVTTLCLNVLCCSCVGFITSKYLLFAARLGTGMTQATFVIFFPIWVDKFAPRESLTTWMAVNQAAAAIGVIVGYGAGAVGSEWPDQWVFVFILQGIILLALVMLLAASNPAMLEVSADEEQQAPRSHALTRQTFIAGPQLAPFGGNPGAISFANPANPSRRMTLLEPAGRESFRASAKILFKNKVFLGCSLALCGLYFVVTGIQFWSTSYLESLYSLSHMVISQKDDAQGNSCPADVVGSYTRYYMKSYNGAYTYYNDDENVIMYFEETRWRVAQGDRVWANCCPVAEGDGNFSVIEGEGSQARPDKAKWTKGCEVTSALDQRLIFICFAIVAATGPTAGVILGGIFVDNCLGGFLGHDKLVSCLRLCMIWGAIATVIGVIAGVADMFWLILLCFWILLFFGGCIVAPATGILVAIVPPHIKPIANSMSMVGYNVFGYSLGSILPGFFQSLISPCNGVENPQNCDTSMVERRGMQLILGWSIFGFGGMFLAWISAKRDPEMGANMVTDNK